MRVVFAWRSLVLMCLLATVAAARAAAPALPDAAPVAKPVFDCAGFRAYPGPPGLRKMFQLCVGRRTSKPTVPPA